MKKLIFNFAFIALLFLFIGCTDENPVFFYSGSDTTSAILIVRGSTSYISKSNNDYDALTLAYISDDEKYINVNSISCNDKLLSSQKNYEGQYSGLFDYPQSPPYTATWKVNGYRGADFSETVQLVNPMSLPIFRTGDTISKKYGKIILYDGSQTDIGNLNVQIEYDAAMTEFEIHPDSVKTGIKTIDFEVEDNGTINIKPTNLESLPSNQHYRINIAHSKYEVFITPNNYKFAKLSIYNILVGFYLSE